MSGGELQNMLRVAAERPVPPRFWLRDDDATVPSAALDRLLAMVTRHGVPVTLAAIPAGTGQALADRLQGEGSVTVAVHGWAHRNHAGPDEKKQELGIHRPAGIVLGELGQGLRHLQALHGARAVPMLVPPWNRIHPDIVAGLPDAGYAALSVFGPEKAAPLRVLNTHVDLIDWRGTGRVKDLDTLLAEIATALPRDRPIGLLTHHLIHDADAWAVLDRLLGLASELPSATWPGLQQMIGLS